MLLLINKCRTMYSIKNSAIIIWWAVFFMMLVNYMHVI